MTKFNLSKEKIDYFNKKYLDRLKKERGKNNFAEYRNKESQRFEKVEKTFPVLGKKHVWKEVNPGYNLNLQESRGIGIDIDTSMELILKKIEKEMDKNTLQESDSIRFHEITQFLNQIKERKDIKNMIEIGFRVPKVQSLFESMFDVNTFGVDINGFNCELFSEFGYNVDIFDLNKDSNLEKVFNTKFDIVCCYHVIEHLENPFEAINKIYDAMEEGGIFHVEIPIEQNKPQLEFGHLFGFMPGELGDLLKSVGFNMLYATNKTHTGGSWIERYIVMKGAKND